MEQSVSVRELLDRLAHEEQQAKRLGMYAHAEGIRRAITILLRLADEIPPP